MAAAGGGGGGETMSLVWVRYETMLMVKELGHGGPHVNRFSMVLWFFRGRGWVGGEDKWTTGKLSKQAVIILAKAVDRSTHDRTSAKAVDRTSRCFYVTMHLSRKVLVGPCKRECIAVGRL